jgi:hypothetical protein
MSGNILLPASTVFFVCLTVTPVAATTSWSCTFSDAFGHEKKATGAARIDIDGNKFRWSGLFQPNSGTKWATTESKLLENNAVGVVAVSSRARVYTKADGPMYRGIGPAIGAGVTIIDKSSGALRVGSVTASGEYDILVGHCKPQ